MANFNTGSGGGSAGDFDDSFNEAMGYSGGSNDQNDGGGGGGRGGSGAEVDINMGIVGEGADRQDEQMDELDRISDLFDRLDVAYEKANRGNWANSIRDYTVLNADMEVMNFDPRGSRVGAEEAAFLAGAIGFDELESELQSKIPSYEEGLSGSLQKLGTNLAEGVASRFGTSVTRDYIVSPAGEGYIGKVFDDFEFTDFVGNVIGMAVPGGAKVDRALATDITGREQGAMDYAYASTAFGESASLLSPQARESQIIAAREAMEARRELGGGDPEYAQAVTRANPLALAATRPFRSSLRPLFMRAVGPSIYPSAYEMVDSAFDSLFKEGGEVKKKANGGTAYDSQMDKMMSAKPRPMFDPVAVKKNPEAFMKNPMKAGSSVELQEMYAYNQAVLDLADRPLRVQEGMQVGQPQGQPSGDGPVGFVGKKKPENLPESKTVADDVPLDVEEGTFIINAAAVEFAGSEDIKKMILQAIDEARRQGVDISGDENKIDRENAVSLLVSEGEVVIPPLLAEIIGYDRLNKINNRGKAEVEERVEENGQSPEAEALDEQPQNPSEGMLVAYDGGKMAKGGKTPKDADFNPNLSDREIEQFGGLLKKFRDDSARIYDDPNEENALFTGDSLLKFSAYLNEIAPRIAKGYEKEFYNEMMSNALMNSDRSAREQFDYFNKSEYSNYDDRDISPRPYIKYTEKNPDKYKVSNPTGFLRS